MAKWHFFSRCRLFLGERWRFPQLLIKGGILDYRLDRETVACSVILYFEDYLRLFTPQNVTSSVQGKTAKVGILFLLKPIQKKPQQCEKKEA